MRISDWSSDVCSSDLLFEKLEDFSVVFLLPLFFAFSGLRTDVLALGTDPELWLYTGLVLAVAVAGKWGRSTLAAKPVGMRWRDSLRLSILMHCRGPTGPVILHIGLEVRGPPPHLIALLVIIALVTPIMTHTILALPPPQHIH